MILRLVVNCKWNYIWLNGSQHQYESSSFDSFNRFIGFLEVDEFNGLLNGNKVFFEVLIFFFFLDTVIGHIIAQ